MTAQQRAVGRNLALDVVAAIGVGVMAALISTLLPTIARRGGLEPIGLAALAAAPYLANLLGGSPVASDPGRSVSWRSCAGSGPHRCSSCSSSRRRRSWSP